MSDAVVAHIPIIESRKSKRSTTNTSSMGLTFLFIIF